MTSTREHPTKPQTARPRRTRHVAWVVAALVAQAGLVGVAVAPQLSARVTGQEYRVRVAPVDPIDPFRGAYVDLSYPGLRDGASDHAPGMGTVTVYVPLVRDTAAGADPDLWTGAPQQLEPPAGPYLRCEDEGFRRRCGIESWFVPQDKAAALERDVRDGHAIAVLRVDGRGNAAIVDLQPQQAATGS